MYFLYNILAILIVIVAIPAFLFRLLRERGFAKRLKQSFGFLPFEEIDNVAGKECIWLHAASVGEIVAASPIVKEIRRQFPEKPVLVSVVTTGGYAMAKNIIKDADSIIFFPLDLPYLAKSVLKKIKPCAVILVETELWPNFLTTANKIKIPVMMVNGRISDKSLKRYTYLRGILKNMLNTIAVFCMQSELDAQYIIKLGADPDRVVVTGNTKFDQTYTEVTYEEQQELCCQLGFKQNFPIIVAGSTHKGEEIYIFKAFEKVREQYPTAKLILAPRNIMRADEIAILASNLGFISNKRSNLLKSRTVSHDIVILDTIGELGKIYSVGSLVFVGGSMIEHGGHNILEPAAHGKPIIVGPHMFNFKETYKLFTDRNACLTVHDEHELAVKMLYIIDNDKVRQDISNRVYEIIRENGGAAQKSVRHLKDILADKQN